MNISSTPRPEFTSDASSLAAQGIKRQIERLERNVTEVAKSDVSGNSGNSITTALVEQQENVRAVQANARSLEAAHQTIGTLLDVKV